MIMDNCPVNDASSKSTDSNTYKVLVCATGSVATIKLLQVIQQIETRISVIIKVVLTENSKHFLPSINHQIYDDSHEWKLWNKIGDPVLHIDLRNWADLCLIAPLDANTLGKIASGICDNLLTCIVRAWDVTKPLIYCPAMNTAMYNHPVTLEQLNRLQSFGYKQVDCIEKLLACGDFGLGAMATPESIAEAVEEILRSKS